MLSAVVEEPNRMAVRERPQPHPDAGKVRVRVRFAGMPAGRERVSDPKRRRRDVHGGCPEMQRLTCRVSMLCSVSAVMWSAGAS
jgi:hypothetical protein